MSKAKPELTQEQKNDKTGRIRAMREAQVAELEDRIAKRGAHDPANAPPAKKKAKTKKAEPAPDDPPQEQPTEQVTQETDMRKTNKAKATGRNTKKAAARKGNGGGTRTRLTEADVRAIRKSTAHPNELSVKYKVHPTYIRHVKAKRVHAHVK